jgi:CBS domain-containing protein
VPQAQIVEIQNVSFGYDPARPVLRDIDLAIPQGAVVGMLTFHELLRALASRGGALGELQVADIMVEEPVTASPEMEVNDLRRTMLDSGARYLPVLQDGRLLGVISFRDVAKAVLEEQDFENKMLKGYIKNWPA